MMDMYDAPKGKLSVKEIEARLTTLAQEDVTNPEIYELLKQLAAIFIFQNRYVYGYSDVEGVCHDVAADTYLRLSSGRTQITHWMYYISTSIKLSYIGKQRKLEHEVIDTEGNPSLRKAVITMCAGSSKSISTEFNNIYKINFLQNIDSLIRRVVNCTKFKPESKEWWTLYTNLCLSLYFDKIVYFRIPGHLKPYLNLLIQQFRDMFLNSEFTQHTFDEEEEDLPSLIFYDEQAVKDTDKRRDI
jgi:hypothetical protein